jgi:hypothetical protein
MCVAQTCKRFRRKIKFDKRYRQIDPMAAARKSATQAAKRSAMEKRKKK